MISTSIRKAFQKAKERNWSRLTLAIDIHDTMVIGNHNRDIFADELYPKCLESLNRIQNRGDINLVLWSSSWHSDIVKYQEWFKEKHDIVFHFINENPTVPTKPDSLGCYEKKFYFDMLIEDKGGFEPETDWSEVFDEFGNHEILS